MRCGEYSLGTTAASLLPGSLTSTQIANISGHIRENQGLLITARDLAYLKSLPTPRVGVKGEKLLIALAKEYPVPGTPFWISIAKLISDVRELSTTLSSDSTYPDDRFADSSREASKWVAASWASSPKELNYLINDFLVGRGLLHYTPEYTFFDITPDGWAAIEDLRESKYSEDSGFVAMAFKPDLKQVFDDAIAPGVRAAGYKPIRMDRVEHNNRIDDEIIARIRQTKFLIADFTENRAGVYFEAGFALGLGHSVIWTVRDDQLEAVHFDTRQYNFIRWKMDELAALAKALQNRIEAALGKGPLPPSS